MMEKAFPAVLIAFLVFLGANCAKQDQAASINGPAPEEGGGAVLMLKNETPCIFDLDSGQYEELALPEGFELFSGFDTYVPKTDFVILTKENEIYLYDLKNGETSKTSIPPLRDEGDVYETVSQVMLSPDKTEAMISIALYDKDSEEFRNEFAGPLPVSRRQIIYDLANDEWKDSDAISRARELVGEDFIAFVRWDNVDNVLYGHVSAEGIGNRQPVYAVDLDDGSVRRTPAGDDPLKPFFSPSLEKIVLHDVRGNSLQVFDARDLDAPEKALDLGDIGADSIYAIAWSSDEAEIALGCDDRIYTLDLETGDHFLRWSDDTLGQAYMHWDRNHLICSPAGKGLIFVDYDNVNQVDKNTMFRDENNRFLLTASDLEGEGSVILDSSTDSLHLISAAEKR